MTKKHKRKHSGECSQDSTKKKQDVHVQEIIDSEECEVHVPEYVSSTKAKSTEYVSRVKKHKKKKLDDICNTPKDRTHNTGENEISKSQQIVDSQEISELSHVESTWLALLSSTDACSPEKSVNLTKALKRKHSGECSQDSTKKKQDVHVQEIIDSEECEVHVPEYVSSTKAKSTEYVSRVKKHKKKKLDDICNTPKDRTHNTGENEISKSQQIVDSQEISELSHVESTWLALLSSTDACSPEKSVNLTKALKRKHSGECSQDSTKKKQDVHVQEIIDSEECEVHVPEYVSSTKAKSTEYVSRVKKHKKKKLGDICTTPRHRIHNTGENEISKSRQIVDSQEISELPHVESTRLALLSSTDACSPEKSVNLTKALKRKHSGECSQDSTKKKQDVHVQEIIDSEECEVHVPEYVSSTKAKSTEYVSRVKKHKKKKLDDICNTPKDRTHNTGENEISKSRQIVDSQEFLELPLVESIRSDLMSSTDACSPEKSVKLTKALKRKNSNVTPDKQKRKKQKHAEKEVSESQDFDVSGYHEPVTETSDLNLDYVSLSSAQKLISDADDKKSVDYRTATKSYPVLSKSTDEQSSRRLAEFKGCNFVSYSTWKKVCTELEKEGKKYNSGRFSYEENEQLKKNWAKVTKSCPFEKPHALLMKNHFPDLKNDIESYVKDTNFYARLGKHINRPLYSVYTRARKVFYPGNFKGRYTEEEVDMLKRQHHLYGSQWQKIGQCMERSGQSLNDKFKKLKTTTVLGRWSPEEDAQLREAVKTLVSDKTGEEEAYFNFPWTEIARGVPTRNAKQCRDHWLNMLAFGNKGKNWFGKADKIRLIYEIMTMNVSHESEIDWIELKSKFDVPSPQFLQHKWYLLRVKVPDFQRCSLREVLEYLERDVVPGMKAILEKKSDGDSTVGDTVVQTDSSETLSKSKTQHEEVKEDEEDDRVCPLSEASQSHSTHSIPAWRVRFPQMTGAVDWLNANRHLFQQTVLEPQAMSMSEHENEKLIALDAESVIPTYHIAEATSFMFKDSDDLDLFIQKVRVALALHVNCAMM